MSRLRFKVIFATVFLCFASGPVLAQDSIRASLFEQARDALIAANKANASLLAPTSYAAASDHYQRAEALLERGGNLDRIRSELAKAEAKWAMATAAADTARTVLGNAMQARADAKNAGAEEFAKESWEDGEREFASAAERLEAGSEKAAERIGGRAETTFRAAELAAIKANYLNETASLLDKAADLRAKRYAPATFADASALVAEAETELTENRYDTDRPRSIAQSAKHQAKLAIYLAENLKRVDKDREQLEAFVLDWQTPLRRIGAVLDIPVYFDSGYQEATDQLVTRIDELLKDNQAQSQDLAERKAQIREMESQIATLEQRLGGASEERLALAAQLDRQARIRDSFVAVERMFQRDDADVLRSGNNVILRLVGLTFESGKADIDADKFELLARVQKAISQFERSSIAVEGHTDAFGSDASNMDLSTERAEAVRSYMLANMGLAPTQVVANGYGETRPIANNETPEGRAKNRRIDIVIRPTF